MPFVLRHALLAAGWSAALGWSAADLAAVRRAFDDGGARGLEAAEAAVPVRPGTWLTRPLGVAPVPVGKVLLYEARVCTSGAVEALPAVHHGCAPP